jgi:hypothetical protein
VRASSASSSAVAIVASVSAALGVLALPPQRAAALETDQFTVPPRPLADIGPELAAEVVARIDAAVARVNDRAAAHAARAGRASGFWRRHHLRERDRHLGEAALAREVYRALAGPAVPECRIERWVRHHPFARGPARFEVTCGGSAYGPSPLGRSPLLWSLSPTVNAFGEHFGVDKIGHLFQQGHQYHERFLRASARPGGRGPAGEAEALAHAVRLGVEQERGWFGEALVGVYSNADLAANYAGLKLYLNLTRPVRVGGAVRPPLLTLAGGQWRRNPAAAAAATGDGAGRAGAAFLRPFISEHLNESLNPSRYGRPTRGTVRARWRERAAGWVAFYASTRASESARLARLATWHGEPYGHSGFDALVTALDTCFPDGADDDDLAAGATAAAAAGPAAPARPASRVPPPRDG